MNPLCYHWECVLIDNNLQAMMLGPTVAHTWKGSSHTWDGSPYMCEEWHMDPHPPMGEDVLVMPMSCLNSLDAEDGLWYHSFSHNFFLVHICDGIKELVGMELTWDEPSIDQDLFKNLSIIFSLSIGMVYVSFLYADLCCVFVI